MRNSISRLVLRLLLCFACLAGAAAAENSLRAADPKPKTQPVHRDLVLTSRYLLLPVRTGAPKCHMRFVIDNKTVREFDIELAEGEPAFWAFAEMGAFKGKTLRIETTVPETGRKSLAAIRQGDEIKGKEPLYREKHRPQFHFTSRRGWLNDPNGLVSYKGEYHLFYQHNPYGWDWGNMHWGHAVSKDLVHWRELPIALYPQKFGDWCFSGSAVVDTGNSAGFQKGNDPPLVAAYTSTGRGECIIYSNDRGRTWTEYAANPVVRHQGRDPRLLRHEPSKQWVMAVYDEVGKTRNIAFYSSPNLKEWKFQSRIPDFFECPDLFELPVDGDAGKKKWVLYAADGKYLLGAFDGKKFTPESGKHQVWYGNFYAAQTFSNTPDGRRIQIGWGNDVKFPDMPFNQQMTVPCRLTLRTTARGVRMFAEPVQEIKVLHGKKHAWAGRTLKPSANLLDKVTGELFDIRAELEAAGAEAFGFTVRGVPVVYDVKKQQLSCLGRTAPLQPDGGKVRLRLLADRGSLEIFGNDGRVAMSIGVLFPGDRKSLDIFSRGGDTRVAALEVFELKSAWEKP
jgi:fructan beta-fructosidase